MQMDKPEITVEPLLFYNWFCPYVHRVTLALNAKQWRMQQVDIDLEAKPTWLTEFSPHGKVPFIVYKEQDQQVVLYESLVLTEYIEEVKKDAAPLLPSKALERARARIIIGRFDSVLVPLFYKLLRETDQKAALELAAKVHEELKWLQSQMHPTGPFFLGEDFSLVECDLLPWFLRAFILEHYRGFKLLEGFPRLESWLEKCRQHPAVVASLRPPQEGQNWEAAMIPKYKKYGGEPVDLFH